MTACEHALIRGTRRCIKCGKHVAPSSQPRTHRMENASVYCRYCGAHPDNWQREQCEHREPAALDSLAADLEVAREALEQVSEIVAYGDISDRYVSEILDLTGSALARLSTGRETGDE